MFIYNIKYINIIYIIIYTYIEYKHILCTQNFYFDVIIAQRYILYKQKKIIIIYIYTVYNIIKGKQVCVCKYTCTYIYIYIYIYYILADIAFLVSDFKITCNCLFLCDLYRNIILYCIILYYIIFFVSDFNYHNSSGFSMISLEIDAPTAKECTTHNYPASPSLHSKMVKSTL